MSNLLLILEDIVLNVLVLREVGHFLVVDKFLNAAIDGTLSGTDSIVSELNDRAFLALRVEVLLSVLIDVKHDHALAS